MIHVNLQFFNYRQGTPSSSRVRSWKLLESVLLVPSIRIGVGGGMGKKCILGLVDTENVVSF